MNEGIYQHKIDNIIRAALLDDDFLSENGITLDSNGIASVNIHQIRNYAEAICNELASELELAKALIVHNDQ